MNIIGIWSFVVLIYTYLSCILHCKLLILFSSIAWFIEPLFKWVMDNTCSRYQTSVASKFPLFISQVLAIAVSVLGSINCGSSIFSLLLFLSQDGTNGAVKKKALDYKQITYMQVQREMFCWFLELLCLCT